MAESTKGVEENDKGIEGKRGDIGARGEMRNGGRKREEEEEEEEEKMEEEKKEEEDEKEVGEERAIKEKSEATCTRQQPPTSEELIINLLSPSPNATVLTRSPSLHFHLRLSLAYHPLSRPFGRPLHSHLSFHPRTLPFPFRPEFPSIFPLFTSLPFSFAQAAPGCMFTITITRALTFAAFPSRSRFRSHPVLSTSKPCRYFRST